MWDPGTASASMRIRIQRLKNLCERKKKQFKLKIIAFLYVLIDFSQQTFPALIQQNFRDFCLLDPDPHLSCYDYSNRDSYYRAASTSSPTMSRRISTLSSKIILTRILLQGCFNKFTNYVQENLNIVIYYYSNKDSYYRAASTSSPTTSRRISTLSSAPLSASPPSNCSPSYSPSVCARSVGRV